MSPPDSSEGGPRAGSRPVATNAAAAKLQVPEERTTTSAAHVWATPYYVMGTRGRLRVILVVERCAFGCGQSHLHSGPVDFDIGRRKAGCGGGAYLVHVLAQGRAA